MAHVPAETGAINWLHFSGAGFWYQNQLHTFSRTMLDTTFVNLAFLIELERCGIVYQML